MANIIKAFIKTKKILDKQGKIGQAALKAFLRETSGVLDRPWIRPEDILGIADRQLDPAPPATTTRSNNFYK